MGETNFNIYEEADQARPKAPAGGGGAVEGLDARVADLPAPLPDERTPFAIEAVSAPEVAPSAEEPTLSETDGAVALSDTEHAASIDLVQKVQERMEQNISARAEEERRRQQFVEGVSSARVRVVDAQRALNREALIETMKDEHKKIVEIGGHLPEPMTAEEDAEGGTPDEISGLNLLSLKAYAALLKKLPAGVVPDDAIHSFDRAIATQTQVKKGREVASRTNRRYARELSKAVASITRGRRGEQSPLEDEVSSVEDFFDTLGDYENEKADARDGERLLKRAEKSNVSKGELKKIRKGFADAQANADAWESLDGLMVRTDMPRPLRHAIEAARAGSSAWEEFRVNLGSAGNPVAEYRRTVYQGIVDALGVTPEPAAPAAAEEGESVVEPSAAPGSDGRIPDFRSTLTAIRQAASRHLRDADIPMKTKEGFRSARARVQEGVAGVRRAIASARQPAVEASQPPQSGPDALALADARERLANFAVPGNGRSPDASTEYSDDPVAALELAAWGPNPSAAEQQETRRAVGRFVDALSRGEVGLNQERVNDENDRKGLAEGFRDPVTAVAQLVAQIQEFPESWKDGTTGELSYPRSEVMPEMIQGTQRFVLQLLDAAGRTSNQDDRTRLYDYVFRFGHALEQSPIESEPDVKIILRAIDAALARTRTSSS